MYRFLLSIMALSSFAHINCAMAQQKRFALTKTDTDYLLLCATTPSHRAHIFSSLCNIYKMADKKEGFVLLTSDKEYFELCATTPERAHIFEALINSYRDEKISLKNTLDIKSIVNRAIAMGCAQQLKLMRSDIDENYFKKEFRNALREKNTAKINVFIRKWFL